MRVAKKISIVAPMIISVAACGGGGEKPRSTPAAPPSALTELPSASQAPSPITTPSGANFVTKEYQVSNAAVASNAIGAWQMGATGKGVTIGFVDTGVVPSRSDFTNKIHAGSRDVAGSRTMDDTSGHGTAVAGIAAGARDDRGMHGVAFDASIFMAKADQGCPESCTFSADATATGIDAARLAGARVINLSIGGVSAREIDGAVVRAAEAGIVIVVGSGNSGPAPSEFAQRLAKLAPANVIVVGALGTAASDTSPISYDAQSRFSAPASTLRDHYIAAPGLYNAATYFRSDGIDRLSGSSFAAPVVSGAVALLAQAFPSLSPSQLISLLYETADDLGITGIDDVFGRGRLNIGRAFQPVGKLRPAGGGFMVAREGTLSVPLATGDAIYRNEVNTIVLDNYNRAFPYDLTSAFVVKTAPGPLSGLSTANRSHTSIDSGLFKMDLTLRGATPSKANEETQFFSNLTEPQTSVESFSIIAGIWKNTSLTFGNEVDHQFSNQSANRIGSLSLSSNQYQQYGFSRTEPRSVTFRHSSKRLSLVLLGESGKVVHMRPDSIKSSYSVLSGSLLYGIKETLVSASLNRLIEEDSLLGSDLLGVFGGGRAKSYFLDFEISRLFPLGLSVSAKARFGRSHSFAADLLTQAFAIEAMRSGVFSRKDQLMINLSQPLRVETGEIGALLPTGWDYDRNEAQLSRVPLKLVPSGRELKLELGYALSSGLKTFTMNAYARRHPDHFQSATTDVGVAIRGRSVF